MSPYLVSNLPSLTGCSLKMLNQNCASFFCFKLYICQCYNYSLILLACAPLLYKWYTGRLHLTSTAWCSMNILIANTNIWNFAWQALECLIAIELQFKAQKTLHVIAIKGLYPNSHGYVTLSSFSIWFSCKMPFTRT